MTGFRILYRVLLISSALVLLLISPRSIIAQPSRESPAELRNSGGSRHFFHYFHLEPYCGLGIVAGNAVEEYSVVGIKPGVGVTTGLEILFGKPENAGRIYWGIDAGFAAYLHRRKIYRYEPFADVSMDICGRYALYAAIFIRNAHNEGSVIEGSCILPVWIWEEPVMVAHELLE